MAAFCTKCGAVVASDTGFCPACGAPMGVVAASTPAAAVPPPVQAMPPPGQAAAYTQPVTGYPPAAAYPPAGVKSSGGALKIILIVLAVVIGLGVIGSAGLGFMAWRVSKSIRVNNDGSGGATVSLPGVGTVTSGNNVASDAELGVPAYPGAVREKGGINLNSGSASMVMAHFTTSDAPGQVVDFYKGKMGNGAIAVDTGNGTVLNSGGQDTNRIMVTVGPGQGSDAGRTTIVIMHTQKK